LYLTNEFALASVEFLLLQSFCALAWESGPLNSLKHLPFNADHPDGHETHAPPILNWLTGQLDLNKT
jgi:hypothetical protein